MDKISISYTCLLDYFHFRDNNIQLSDKLLKRPYAWWIMNDEQFETIGHLITKSGKTYYAYPAKPLDIVPVLVFDIVSNQNKSFEVGTVFEAKGLQWEVIILSKTLGEAICTSSIGQSIFHNDNTNPTYHNSDLYDVLQDWYHYWFKEDSDTYITTMNIIKKEDVIYG